MLWISFIPIRWYNFSLKWNMKIFLLFLNILIWLENKTRVIIIASIITRDREMKMNIDSQIGMSEVCLSTFSHHDTTNCELEEDCNVNQSEIRIPINVRIFNHRQCYYYWSTPTAMMMASEVTAHHVNIYLTSNMNLQAYIFPYMQIFWKIQDTTVYCQMDK